MREQSWLRLRTRVRVTDGLYLGQCGDLRKDLGRGEWMVKLDGHMFGTTIAARDMEPELRGDR